MHDAGIEIVLVTTLVNNVNNEEVGPIIQFARDNPGALPSLPFNRFRLPAATRKSPTSAG